MSVTVLLVHIIMNVKAILHLQQTTQASATLTLLEHNSCSKISDHNVKTSSAVPSH